MNPFLSLLRIDWSAPRLRLFDFGLAVATVAFGLVFDSAIALWAGVAGLALAIVNPMGRMQKFMAGFRRSAPGKGPSR
jgi:hypothetical protein